MDKEVNPRKTNNITRSNMKQPKICNVFELNSKEAIDPFVGQRKHVDM